MDLELIIGRKNYCINDFDFMSNENDVLSKVFEYFLDAYNLSKEIITRYDDRSGAPEETKLRVFKNKNIRSIVFKINNQIYPIDNITEALGFIKHFIDERKVLEYRKQKEDEFIFNLEFNSRINSLTIDQKRGLLLLLDGLALLK